ncbi:MAG: hypothetical protein AAGL49_13410, partial [Pseudomonadota bacterium]
IIDAIHAYDSDIEIFVSQILPVRSGLLSEEEGDDLNQLVNTANASIEAMVNSKSGNVQFVDMPDFTSADISAPGVDNGLHPTAGGFIKIADNWFDAVDGELSLTSTALVADATSAPDDFFLG